MCSLWYRVDRRIGVNSRFVAITECFGCIHTRTFCFLVDVTLCLLSSRKPKNSSVHALPASLTFDLKDFADLTLIIALNLITYFLVLLGQAYKFQDSWQVCTLYCSTWAIFFFIS